MSLNFEELDFCQTRLGELSLRRRRFVQLGARDIYEVKLGDEFLMSSLFTSAEIALADQGLADLGERALDVVVGGLGLGYTAIAALAYSNVRELLVIEGLAEVIGWHEQGLLPDADILRTDARCRFVHGDFFRLVDQQAPDPDQPGRQFDAILLDIDHAPDDLLADSHAGFYQRDGLTKLLGCLRPGGVFALWSNDPPAASFSQRLSNVFVDVAAHVVAFENPLQGGQSSNTVYVARHPGSSG